ncbi:tripartite tricarboxylate transporter permease [Aquicoccus sp. G2-2]|uniref:tripartite tricarboxylate transporter permease n=1 Tax=Aquicoccus sp. G2-2 TaxID=3092120 RepID=UPI002AE08D77|nr:tripartite tricarboxylate transporter permease [Aquicoccus sp. G2-2]MEA1114819.1 tripartite tricarboxylate transporter permease [Aquicoccus sp. G2-2]
MLDLSTILAGFGDAFNLVNLFFVLAGVTLGQLIGAVPGIGPVMAMAVAIPFTFGMNALPAIAFLVGVNKGGLVGGAVPAVLINTPGTPDAAATALDGHALARQGKPEKAMKMALFSSVTGDTFSDIVLITVSPLLAVLALKMGPIEIFALMILAFSVLAGLIGDSIPKGIIAAAAGLLCAMVGLEPEHGTPRLFFGYFELYDGLPLPSVAIGMLAISEILRRLATSRSGMGATIEFKETGDPADRRVSFVEYWACRFTMLRGAVIGTFLGALPGIGSTAAAFMSYASAKQTSDDPESFGKGNLHGIAAAESANSAVVGANLIPLLTLGIPGSVSAALIISAFIIHGIQPGPLLFHQQGRLIYGLFGAMLMANVMNLLVGQFGLRLWTRVIKAPESVIFSAAILLCIVGVSMASGGLFGVAVMLVFAGLGYVMTTYGYPVVVFIIAFFLGPRFEVSLAQSLTLTRGNLFALQHNPIALVLLVCAVASIWWMGVAAPKRQQRRAAARAAEAEKDFTD